MMKRLILILALISLCSIENYGQEVKHYDLSISSLTPKKEGSKFYFNQIGFKYYTKSNIGIGLDLRGRHLFEKETDFLCGISLCSRTNLELDIPLYLAVSLGSGYSEQYFDGKKDKSPIFTAKVGVEFPFWKSLYFGLYTETLTVFAHEKKYEYYLNTSGGIRL